MVGVCALRQLRSSVAGELINGCNLARRATPSETSTGEPGPAAYKGYSAHLQLTIHSRHLHWQQKLLSWPRMSPSRRASARSQGLHLLVSLDEHCGRCCSHHSLLQFGSISVMNFIPSTRFSGLFLCWRRPEVGSVSVHQPSLIDLGCLLLLFGTSETKASLPRERT